MRNKILGIIGILWGGLIVISFIARGIPIGDSSYVIGQYAGLILGLGMFILGIKFARK